MDSQQSFESLEKAIAFLESPEGESVKGIRLYDGKWYRWEKDDEQFHTGHLRIFLGEKLTTLRVYGDTDKEIGEIREERDQAFNEIGKLIIELAIAKKEVPCPDCHGSGSSACGLICPTFNGRTCDDNDARLISGCPDCLTCHGTGNKYPPMKFIRITNGELDQETKKRIAEFIKTNIQDSKS